MGGWVDAFEACAEMSGVGLAVAYFVPALVAQVLLGSVYVFYEQAAQEMLLLYAGGR